MIIVRISGGLGNQMFQYAFAKALQSRGNKVLLHWHGHHSKSSHNGFELNRVFKKNITNQIPLVTNSLIERCQAWFLRKTVRQREVRELHFQPHFLDIKSGYLDGYWQTEQYFESIADEIRADFMFKPITGAPNLDLIDQLTSAPHCSIHIRRGDYVGHPELGGICDEAYYRKALSELDTRHPNCPTLVFSDEIEFAKALLKGRAETLFCDWNRGSDSWMDLALMQACPHHIIANSSFSWWGAWLGDKKGTTIAPSKWSLKEGAGTDVIPKDWIRL